MKLVSVVEMQAVEREADASGLTYALMMENAGRGLAEIVRDRYGHLEAKSVLGLVGSGNNGGDTLVALALLSEWGWRTTAYTIRPRPADDPLVARLEKAGGKMVLGEKDRRFRELADLLGDHLVLLDGILGTGARLPLKKDLAEVLGFVRQTLAEIEIPPRVVAVDCPSGVDCDTGEAAVECLPAELTVTMAAIKAGLLRFPAHNLVGELRLVGIGKLDGLEAWESLTCLVADADLVRASLPPRPLDAHKGAFGAALVVAGSVNYTGAALLAGQAAYRVGAGWVTLAVPAPLHTILAGQFPEATWVLLPHDMGVIAADAAHVLREALDRPTAMLLGPGFGLEDATRDFLSRLLGVETPTHRRGLGFVQSASGAGPATSTSLPPLVCDADGLKLLAQLPGWPARLPALAVLTPHPGEMAVLTGLSRDEIQADRLGVVRRFAKEWGHVVVLKGAFTVIASPDGRSTVIPVATPALARAGTGDVLAGLIVGLRAQGVAAFPAAVDGAWIHAQAGLRAAEALGNTASVLPSDVLGGVIDVLSGLVNKDKRCGR
jgi:NAD(P)H-hydrate epimerase